MAKPNRGELGKSELNTTITPRFIGIKEFSLVMTLSESTIRRRVKDGTYPAIQPGGKRHRILLPLNAFEEGGQHYLNKPPGLVPLPSSRPKSGPKPKWQQD